MRDFIGEFRVLVSYPRNIVLLLARFAVAYGFAMPALMKIDNFETTSQWFSDIGIPFATFMAYLVSAIEVTGIILLILGLFTRYISVLMMAIMLGAIFFVHMQHGYSVANNGIEIPLYYFIFLSFFLSFGPGKFSLDHYFFRGGEYAQ